MSAEELLEQLIITIFKTDLWIHIGLFILCIILYVVMKMIILLVDDVQDDQTAKQDVKHINVKSSL